MVSLCKGGNEPPGSLKANWLVNKENLERQETNKNGSGTGWHLPKTDESVVRPAGERR